MAQTLVVLSAPSTPPVATEADALSANLSAISNLNNQELLALRVIAKAYQLTQNGGTNYKANYPLLISSAATLLGAFNIVIAPYNAEILGRIEAVLDWSAAYTATATLPTDVQDLVNLMGVLRLLPEATLMRIICFLKWKLAE